MKNLWLLPLIVLVLLLALPYFRWEYTATKTQDGFAGAVVKWKTDAWSGAVVQETFNPRGDYHVKVVKYTDEVIKQATTVWQTITWCVAGSVFLLWLIPIVKSRNKPEKLKE